VASVARYKGERWRARYRDDAGRQVSRVFDRKVDAQRWLDEATAALVTGQYVDPRHARTTLGEYSTEWYARQLGRPSTLVIVDNALRLHILPALGPRALGSIRRGDVQTFVTRLTTRLAPGSVRNVYATLARLLADAAHDRLIVASPCERITLPTLSAYEVVPPTAEDVHALEAAVPARYGALVVLLAGTGLRIGEALGLEVTDVDWLRRTLRVERQRLQSGELGDPKTSSSARTIPLPSLVVDRLAAHLAVHGEGRPDGPLFTDPSGRPLVYRVWKRHWQAANDAAGLDVSTHALRHFCASVLLSGGASVKQVQTLLGHSTAAITLRVYAHLIPGDDDRTRALMDAALAPVEARVRHEGVGPG
jgi:integrase